MSSMLTSVMSQFVKLCCQGYNVVVMAMMSCFGLGHIFLEGQV